MDNFEYDPTATYPNTGERGCSSLQVTRMNLDRFAHLVQNYRTQVTVALTREQLEQLLADDPKAFDDVQPVAQSIAREQGEAK